MKKTQALIFTAIIAAGVPVLSACNPTDEKACSSGEYPVKDSTGAGGQLCVKSGEAIPSGYVTYPSGQTPTKPGSD